MEVVIDITYLFPVVVKIISLVVVIGIKSLEEVIKIIVEDTIRIMD